jgi:hypothetical protein
MASLVLTGDTSGQVTIAAPAVAGTNTLTLLAATATNSVNTLGTAVASTSGTSIDFTGLPSWIKKITVMFANVSTTGTVPITFRLGTSGGIQATGYTGAQGYVGPGTVFTNMSTGFEIYNDTAAITYSGSITFNLLDASTNLWVANGFFGTVGQLYGRLIGGYVTLSSTLTQLRITTTTGTPTFDLGSVNILYEG